MAPEYIIYVPPEYAITFEAEIGQILGGRLIKKKTVAEDEREDISPNQIAENVKGVLHQIPETVLLAALAYWEDAFLLKKYELEVPPKWQTFMLRLRPQAREYVKSAIYDASRPFRSFFNTSVADARNVDWLTVPNEDYYGLTFELETTTRSFLAQAFSK